MRTDTDTDTDNRLISSGQTQTQTTKATGIYHEDRHRVGGGQRGEEGPTTNSCTSGAKNVNGTILGPRFGAKKEKIIPWIVCTYCFCEPGRHWPDGHMNPDLCSWDNLLGFV